MSNTRKNPPGIWAFGSGAGKVRRVDVPSQPTVHKLTRLAAPEPDQPPPSDSYDDEDGAVPEADALREKLGYKNTLQDMRQMFADMLPVAPQIAELIKQSKSASAPMRGKATRYDDKWIAARAAEISREAEAKLAQRSPAVALAAPTTRAQAEEEVVLELARRQHHPGTVLTQADLDRARRGLRALRAHQEQRGGGAR